MELVTKWDRKKRGEVAEILSEEYMSSEESADEDGTMVYVVKAIPWESIKLKKRKRILDQKFSKNHSARSRQHSVKRVRKEGVNSLKAKPSNCPEWASV